MKRRRGRSATTANKEETALLASAPEDYMCAGQRDFFRRRLMTMRDELLQAERDTSRQLQEGEPSPDPLDRATREEALALALRLRDRERRLLAKIEQALVRIEQGSYGWCEATGEPIGLPRLLSRPTATLCLDAQHQRERHQAIHGE